MRIEAEDGGTVGCWVRLHALEDAGAVLQPMRQHVHFRVVPGNQFAVEPDALSWRKAHNALQLEYISRRGRPADIRSDVSEFRIEKRRVEARLTLTGGTVSGCFFLAGSNASHSGPERVADL